jgi:hypothetical protein
VSAEAPVVHGPPDPRQVDIGEQHVREDLEFFPFLILDR